MLKSIDPDVSSGQNLILLYGRMAGNCGSFYFVFLCLKCLKQKVRSDFGLPSISSAIPGLSPAPEGLLPRLEQATWRVLGGDAFKLASLPWRSGSQCGRRGTCRPPRWWFSVPMGLAAPLPAIPWALRDSSNLRALRSFSLLCINFVFDVTFGCGRGWENQK